VVMSARPGRMSTEIAISASYPRNEDFRVSPAYNDYCRRASEALRQAMAQSPDEPE
jgi:NitT/TauT family transport system ATP-binding protein